MKPAWVVIAVILSFGGFAYAADPIPYLKAAPMPFYPGLARQARIEGSVKVNFLVNENGSTSDVEATSGHKLLRSAAIENVSGWTWGWPQPCKCKTKLIAVMVYKLSGKEASDRSPIVTVRWFGISRVEIEADLQPVEYQQSH